MSNKSALLFASHLVRPLQTVLADQRLRAAERRAWQKFVVELISGATALLTFILLSRLQPSPAYGLGVPLFSSPMAPVILLGLWAAVTLRPAVSWRG